MTSAHKTLEHTAEKYLVTPLISDQQPFSSHTQIIKNPLSDQHDDLNDDQFNPGKPHLPNSPEIVQEELLEDEDDDTESQLSNTTSVQNKLIEVKKAFTDIKNSMLVWREN